MNAINPKICVRSKTLGELVTIKGGGTPSRDVEAYWNGPIPWASVKDFKGKEISQTAESISDLGLENSASNLIPAGTILVPTRMAVGKAAINTVDLAINQDLKALFPNEAVNVRYLLHALLASSGDLERRATGATVKGITLEVLRELPIRLPPLPEQKRIAAILDQADALRAKRREALAKLDEMAQAIFVEMFGDPADNPHGWNKVSLGTLISDGPQNGLYKPSSDYGDGTPILRIDSFYDGVVTKLDRLKRLRISSVEQKLYALHADDIVVNRVNSMEYLGKSALIPALPEPMVFESNMMRFTLDREQADPRFIIQHFQLPFIKNQIKTAAKHAVNQSSINQTDVTRFQVICPPLPMQKDFSRYLANIDKQKAMVRKSQAGLESLFTSLQHRAFSGDL